MAEAKASLIVELKDLASDQIKKMGERIENLGAQFEQSKYVFVGAMGAIVAGIGFALHEFAQEELAVQSLTHALANQGITNKSVVEDLRAYASALQATTSYADENIIAAQTQLVQFGLTGKQLKDVTKLTLDFATAKGIDLVTAANLLGKAFAGETTMLQRYGIQVDQNADKTEQWDSAIKQIHASMGGAAEAARQTFIGQMESLKNKFSDFLELIGGVFAPVVGKMADLLGTILDKVTTINPKVGAAIVAVTGLVVAFLGVVTAIGSLIAFWPMLVSAFAVITGPIGATAFALVGVAAIAIVLRNSFEELQKIGVEAAAGLGRAWSGFAEAFSLLLEGRIKEGWERFKSASADAVIAVGEGLKSVTDLTVAEAEKQFQALTDLISRKDTLNKKDTANAKSNLAQQLKDKKAMDEMMKDQAKITYVTLAEADSYAQTEKNKRDAWSYQQQREGADAFRNFMIQGTTSQYSAIKAIAKVFLIQQTIMNANAAAMGAYQAMSSIPWVGPVLGAAAAAAAIVYGIERVSNIAAMASGGMVMPTAGGTIARIGEAGGREAVIPLDSPEAKAGLQEVFGGGVTVNINAGVVVADDDTMKRFAKMIDKELYELRRHRESVSL